MVVSHLHWSNFGCVVINCTWIKIISSSSRLTFFFFFDFRKQNRFGKTEKCISSRSRSVSRENTSVRHHGKSRRNWAEGHACSVKNARNWKGWNCINFSNLLIFVNFDVFTINIVRNCDEKIEYIFKRCKTGSYCGSQSVLLFCFNCFILIDFFQTST